MNLIDKYTELAKNFKFKSPIIARYAPTPSGQLHLGNIANFYLTWKITRSLGGKILLRIDDCDQSRSRREFVEEIFDVLNFLKLDWDQGPKDAEDFYQHYSQNLKTQHYREKLNLIKNETYACECSRKNLDQQVYPKTCLSKNLPLTKDQTALRLKTPDEISMGDFIIWRKDDLPAYHLVSVIDDQDSNVNFIIRGEDLQASTQAQLYLSKCLKTNLSDALIIHHPLITDSCGKKLSKSSHSLSIQTIRNQGISREEIINQVHLFLES